MRGTFTGANAAFHILLWRNKQTCDRFKMNGKAKACYSRAVARFLRLELSCWRPYTRGGYGSQGLDRLRLSRALQRMAAWDGFVFACVPLLSK
jgi:hypothetical protein